MNDLGMVMGQQGRQQQQVPPQASVDGAMMLIFQQLMSQQTQGQVAQQQDDCVNCGGSEAMPARSVLDALQSRFAPLTDEQSVSMRLTSGQVGRLYGPVTRRAYDVGEDGLVVVDVLDARRYEGQMMAGGTLMFERVSGNGSS